MDNVKLETFGGSVEWDRHTGPKLEKLTQLNWAGLEEIFLSRNVFCCLFAHCGTTDCRPVSLYYVHRIYIFQNFSCWKISIKIICNNLALPYLKYSSKSRLAGRQTSRFWKTAEDQLIFLCVSEKHKHETRLFRVEFPLNLLAVQTKGKNVKGRGEAASSAVTIAMIEWDKPPSNKNFYQQPVSKNRQQY